jgi:NADPH:quinone reductase-like Zn-dependent oxidoreductase
MLGCAYASTSKQAREGARSCSDAAQLAELVARVDGGVLRIEVAERRPLTDLAAVHDQATAGRLSGKTVLTPA